MVTQEFYQNGFEMQMQQMRVMGVKRIFGTQSPDECRRSNAKRIEYENKEIFQHKITVRSPGQMCNSAHSES